MGLFDFIRKKKEAEALKKYKDFLKTASKMYGLPEGLMRCSKCRKIEKITPSHLQYMSIESSSLVTYCRDCWAKKIAEKEQKEGKEIKQLWGIKISTYDRRLIDKYKYKEKIKGGLNG